MRLPWIVRDWCRAAALEAQAIGDEGGPSCGCLLALVAFLLAACWLVGAHCGNPELPR